MLKLWEEKNLLVKECLFEVKRGKQNQNISKLLGISKSNALT